MQDEEQISDIYRNFVLEEVRNAIPDDLRERYLITERRVFEAEEGTRERAMRENEREQLRDEIAELVAPAAGFAMYVAGLTAGIVDGCDERGE